MNWNKFEKISMGYQRGKLLKNYMVANPLEQFTLWMQEALKQKAAMPNAFCLSTVDEKNMPDSRIVLLMNYDENGMVFFTNYNSCKGKQLSANNHASMLFFWPELERQIRIFGSVKKVSAQDSDDYFATRPREAQIAAAASPQSQVIESYQSLKDEASQMSEQYARAEKIPRPENWGGYCLTPERYEFWQGGPNRLHDRMRYRKSDSTWIIERLAP